MIELRLPLPPSTNGLYANIPGKGRVKSANYRKWINAAGWALLEQKPKPVAGDYDMWLYVEWPDKRKRDLDNCIKALSDLLVSHQLVEDDSRCQALHIYRSIQGRECTVRVCERKAA